MIRNLKKIYHIYELNDFTICQTNLNVAAEQVIIEMTDGGADYCFECVGMASLVHEAYASCRKVHVTYSHLDRVIL